MKIAVFFSGLVRGNYLQNIEKFHNCFPDGTDFFYTTWKRKHTDNEWGAKSDAGATARKIPLKPAIINHYIEEPKTNFEFDRSTLKKYIRTYKAMVASNWDYNKLPPNITRNGTRALADLKEDILSPIRNYKICRHQHKQVLGHAWAVEHMINKNDYDIIVRLRYDAIPSRNLREALPIVFQMVKDTGMPVGFNYFNDYGLDSMYPGYPQLKFHQSKDLHDFMIVHAPEHLDYGYINYIYEERIMQPAEVGWFNALCRPWDIYSWETIGLVKLHQQHNDEQEFFNKYKADPIPRAKYMYAEKMRSMVGNVDAHLK